MKHYFLLTALFLLRTSSVVAADDSGPLPTAEEIVTRMGSRDLQRQISMEGYAGMRRYVLENQHLHKRAEMLVQVQGDRDGTKHFDILSEEGWQAAHKHVLRKMLESESDTSRPDMRAKTKLNAENYEFEVIGTVDSEDYALVRAEGNPAKNPSFWTKSTHFVQVYQKTGPLWFPLSTQSVTEAHIFGTTDVSIEYFDYAPKALHPPGNFVMSAKEMPKP
jgi:hypothetical protein